MVDKVLYEFLSNERGESVFVPFYDEVDSLCREKKFSIATELMREGNREKLFQVIKKDISAWKIAFIVKVLSNFVKDQRVSVNEFIETPIGKTYYGLVQTIYSINPQNGFNIVTQILDGFAYDCKYLVNMALNIEGILRDLPNNEKDVSGMWKYFGKLMMRYQKGDFETAYSILKDYKRYDQIYMLYSLAMTNAAGLAEVWRVFSQHYKAFVASNSEYSVQYGERVLNDYYRRLEGYSSESAYNAKVELLKIISENKTNVLFAEKLVKDIVKEIPFESPSRENRMLIESAFEYIHNSLHRPVTDRLLLLVIAMVLEECNNTEELRDVFKDLERLTKNNKGDMSRITEDLAKSYFDWLLPNVCKLCKRTSDIESLYDLFEMSSNVSNLFFTACAKIYLKQSKDDEDYGIFCEFLGLVFKEGNYKIRERIGKVLSKLSKQKLSDLDEEVKEKYQNDKTAILHWNEVKDMAESNSPILKTISNLLKRRKE